MKHAHHSNLISMILSLCASLAPAQEKEESGVELKAREQWTTVFGGQSVKLHFDCLTKGAAGYSAHWSYAAGQRRLAAGVLAVKVEADGNASLELPLRIPPVREGVVFETELTISLVRNGETVASLRHPLTIYPVDPFALRKEWLDQLSISLYDPEGETAERFEAAGIPFHRLGTLASIGSVEEGLIIIGEGHSLKVQRGLMDVLTAAAAGGRPVLCLASTEGAFPLPFAAEGDFPLPDSVSLDRTDVIKSFDKHFDAREWGSAGSPVLGSLQIVRSRSGIEAEVTDETSGWSWLELKYGERGAFVWCGFGIIRSWDDNPTPRYLLADLFQNLTETEPSDTISHDKPRSLP